MERERISISISKDLLLKIDQKIDGLKMRNRSHAIELLVSESLGLSRINSAIIMAGGNGALKLIPAIDSTIKELKTFGFLEIFIAVGFLGDKVKQGIGDGKNYDLKINYIEGGEGTAGALLPLKNQLKKTFLVVNIDESMPLNIKNLADFHRSHFGIATIATNNIQTLKGYYLFEPEIFDYLPNEFSMLEEDIFPKLNNENKLTFFPIF